MFWMNLIKKIFLGSDYETERSNDSLQLIVRGWGVEREILPPECSVSFRQNHKS
ncbi:hypothetical protein ACL6C3_30895 [Capilliphycus salinus ALCB114379]|uniref:hypothetical protein n=1 Tax=Capilliphycus salinus TaxID=2768948 RepID=UPI0039A67D0C